ncbi:response regulator [Heliobacterium gestii]|uniref:Stage 0 sporulation protein A homolog n=1 Tax=Heliomicrobium gestii TaxID=2699 RepID=A0A845LAM2_HELGE|nr:response regulator [Heliomicrobium gestii]MBM7867931.1 two-component system chemotaxis response regulator CheY [Heliomicrobium gestii]MZP43258.1 response regulator [Heliomicrobium gestii]
MGKVLVVDDTAFARLSLANLIRMAGHEIVGQAGNGEEAIRLYHDLLPDLVTMDITMPVMDGIEATRQIRKTAPEARIIVVSAMGQMDHVKDCIIAGACDFIVKPFDLERVKNAIARHMGDEQQLA